MCLCRGQMRLQAVFHSTSLSSLKIESLTKPEDLDLSTSSGLAAQWASALTMLGVTGVWLCPVFPPIGNSNSGPHVSTLIYWGISPVTRPTTLPDKPLQLCEVSSEAFKTWFNKLVLSLIKPRTLGKCDLKKKNLGQGESLVWTLSSTIKHQKKPLSLLSSPHAYHTPV